MDKEDRADVPILPPLIPLLMMAIGGAAHYFYPVPLTSGSVGLWIGGALLALSVLVAAEAACELARARTAFDVRKTTSTIVQSGAFRLSRNPIYLAMMLLCLALAFAFNSLLMFLASIPAGSLLCHVVIRPEEAYLEQKFGVTYSRYKRQVRRWL